jgi:hypothetical protein
VSACASASVYVSAARTAIHQICRTSPTTRAATSTANVVLPAPGGPYKSVRPAGVPRTRAATSAASASAGPHRCGTARSTDSCARAICAGVRSTGTMPGGTCPEDAMATWTRQCGRDVCATCYMHDRLSGLPRLCAVLGQTQTQTQTQTQ